MGKQEVLDIIKSNKPEIEYRYGVQQLGLFGSYVRGKSSAGATSTSSFPSTATSICLNSSTYGGFWKPVCIRRLT